MQRRNSWVLGHQAKESQFVYCCKLAGLSYRCFNLRSSGMTSRNFRLFLRLADRKMASHMVMAEWPESALRTFSLTVRFSSVLTSLDSATRRFVAAFWFFLDFLECAFSAFLFRIWLDLSPPTQQSVPADLFRLPVPSKPLRHSLVLPTKPTSALFLPTLVLVVSSRQLRSQQRLPVLCYRVECCGTLSVYSPKL